MRVPTGGKGVHAAVMPWTARQKFDSKKTGK
jgi:hypothetical protein